MATSASLAALPSSLLLLVHLHLLEFPSADKPEYDHNVFNPKTRGLKDRTKTMEDVSHFLVRRLERDRVKSILPNYPCQKPSDSVAYRAALTKYLETLRHTALGSAGHGSAKSGTTVKKGLKESTLTKAGVASFWWKDVLVRKSTLEECAGERFERILLALSVHALMKSVKGANDPGILHSPQAQPITYAARLNDTMRVRKDWLRRMDELQRQKAQLSRLKAGLAQTNGVKGRYEALSTNRLVAFACSKYEDLSSSWSTAALDFLLAVAGVVRPSEARKPGSTSVAVTLSVSRSNFASASTSRTAPQPLPVAAALHPSYLRKLRRNISAGAGATSKGQRTRVSVGEAHGAASVHAAASTHHTPKTDRLVEKEREMKRVLREGLDTVRRRREEASARLQKVLRERKAAPAARAELNVWRPPPPATIYFDTISSRETTLDTQASGPFAEPLQTRIDRVRARWKENAAVRQESKVSRIPKPSATAKGPPLKASTQRARSFAPSGKTTETAPGLQLDYQTTHKPQTRHGRKSVRSRRSARVSLVCPPAIYELGDDEVTQILDQLRDDSSEDESGTPRVGVIPTTPGELLSTSKTPGSLLSTAKRRKRETFAMPPGGPPLPLPEADLVVEDEESASDDRADDDSEDYEEGHSVSLRDILLQANATGMNLTVSGHLEDEMDDDDPFD